MIMNYDFLQLENHKNYDFLQLGETKRERALQVPERSALLDREAIKCRVSECRLHKKALSVS